LLPIACLSMPVRLRGPIWPDLEAKPPLVKVDQQTARSRDEIPAQRGRREMEPRRRGGGGTAQPRTGRQNQGAALGVENTVDEEWLPAPLDLGPDDLDFLVGPVAFGAGGDAEFDGDVVPFEVEDVAEFVANHDFLFWRENADHVAMAEKTPRRTKPKGRLTPC
jgi:hypothetical protein